MFDFDVKRIRKSLVLFSLFSFFSVSVNCYKVDAGLFGVFKKDRNNSENNLSDNAEIKAYANYCVAVSLMMDNKWEPAAESLKKTLEYDPYSDKIHLYLASCYFQQKQRDLAILHMNAASQIKPHDFHIHYTLGNILRSEKRFDEAVNELELAIGCELVDENRLLYGDALLKLANLYVNAKNIEKAISCLNEVVNLNISADPAKLHFEIGRLNFEAKNFESAIDAFKLVLNINPTVFNTHPYLSICYEQLGDLEAAVNEAKAYIDIIPNAWNMHISLYRVYDKLDKKELAKEAYGKAAEILETSIALGSRDVDEYTTLAQILLSDDKNVSALAVLQKGLHYANDQRKRDIHFFMSTISYELNQFDDVEIQLKKVLEIDDTYHQANNFLGYFYAERGIKIDLAIELIKKALIAEPENGAYIDSLGWAYFKKAISDDKDELIELALENLIKASKLADDPEIQEHTGDVYYSLGDWDKANYEWNKALEFIEKGNLRNAVKITDRIKVKVKKLKSLRFFENLDEKELSNTDFKKIKLHN